MSGTVQATSISPPKRAHHGELSKVTTLQDAFDHPTFINRIKQATPKHLSPDRMLAVFVQSVQKTPKLREVNTMSLLGAFLSVATVGLEPNTALQHAHLIPFAKRMKDPNGKWVDGRVDVQVIFGYQGLLELAFRSGLLRSVHADVAWKGDEFEFWYGSHGMLKHRPMGGARDEAELPVWAYMHANMKHEGEAFEVMPISDVLAIRDGSQGYQSALRARNQVGPGGKLTASWTEAPWVKHFIPMARKTVFRAGQKWLPKSIELASAIALDELQDRKSANFAGVIEGSADVLDGGLDALPDEVTDQLEVSLGGTAGPAYSMQSERLGPGTVPLNRAPEPSWEPAPGEGLRDQAQTAPARANTYAPRVTAKAANPAFSAYLIDENGEVAGDKFTDAGLFAEAYFRALAHADDQTTLLENNERGVRACVPFPNAAEILVNEIDYFTGRGSAVTSQLASTPDLTAAIPVTSNARGVDMVGWLKRAREIMPILDRNTMPAWIGNNEPLMKGQPASRRLEFDKMVADRCGAIGLQWGATAMQDEHTSAASHAALVPGPVPNPRTAPQDEEHIFPLDRPSPPPPNNGQIADGLIAEGNNMKTSEHFMAHMQRRGNVLARLRADDEDSWNRVMRAAEAKIASFSSALNGPPMADPNDPGPGQ